MDLEQAKAQDVILNHMNNQDHNSVWDISELHKKLNIEYDLCYICCEEIAYVRDHAEIREGRPTTNYPNDKSIFILSAGNVFAKSQDSYESEFLALIKEQEDSQEEEDLRKRKLKSDVKNSEYLAKVQWWPIVIATLGFMVSIYVATNPQSEIKELKLELKKIKDTISALHLPKTEDLIYKESSPSEYDTILENDSTKIDSLK